MSSTTDTDMVEDLEVIALSGSEDPPYDFPIPGISPSLVSDRS